MAATDVIVVDNSFTLLRHQDTQRIERVLEKWYKDLKANVVTEFLQFRLSLESEQQKTINEMKSKTSPEVVKLRREIDNLRELLHTLERSVSQKDKLVSNLVKSLEKEKEKYEKLRAVSSDKLDQSANESEEQCTEAEKHFNKNLLRRCWASWKKILKPKQRDPDNRIDSENTVIVNIKTEDGSENDAVLSDDSLLVSDSEGSIIERSNAEFDICTTTQDESGRRSYPAYVNASNDYGSMQTAADPRTVGAHSHSMVSTTGKEDGHVDGSDAATDMQVITNDAHTLEPATASVTNGSQASSLPNFARNRKRKRIYVKTAFDRGRKLYQMKDKVRIKKVQSLRVGGASFLGSGDRPTMATNAFQAQESSIQEMPTTMSNISSDTHDVSQSDSFSGQSVVTDPYQQEEGDSDTATTIVHVQPQFGTNQSEWETAKNNISQYMNQMLIQSDAASKEQQRKANESRTCSGVASSLGDSVKSNEEQLAVAAALQSQASTSSTEVKNQDSSEGLQCSSCAHHFDTREALIRHVKLCPAKPKDAPKWVCKECGKSFVSGKRYLQDHIMMVHKGLPPYRCDVCLKGFTTLANFKSHILLHGTERPFNCSHCNKGFAQKGNFLRHLKGIHGFQITFKTRKR